MLFGESWPFMLDLKQIHFVLLNQQDKIISAANEIKSVVLIYT